MIESLSKKHEPLAARPAIRWGGGCHFLGTAATSQVIGEALGLSLPHSALCPSGARIWKDMARRSAVALTELPEDTRLWAALQPASGGAWGQCVYDTESIVASLEDNP